MKILVAPNALKGSVDASSAAAAIAAGLRKGLPEAEIVLLPIADGGDGTAAVLALGTGGVMRTSVTFDALGRPLEAGWGIMADGTAVIDVASASGMARIEPGLRDPLVTSSAGTGELVRAALDLGCRRLLLGVGGSATVDAGTGIARALGARFLNAEGM